MGKELCPCIGGIAAGRVARVKSTGATVFVLEVFRPSFLHTLFGHRMRRIYPASMGYLAEIRIGPSSYEKAITDVVTVEELAPIFNHRDGGYADR